MDLFSQAACFRRPQTHAFVLVRLVTVVWIMTVIWTMTVGTLFAADCGPDGVNQELSITKGSLDIDVFFTDEGSLFCGSPGDFFTANQAQAAVDAVSDIYDRFMSLGFVEAHDCTDEIYIYDIPDKKDANGNVTFVVGGYHDWECINIDAPMHRCSEPLLRETLAHEMFHAIQRTYKCQEAFLCGFQGAGSSYGKWVSEGTAATMEDKLFSDLDSDMTGTFLARVNSALDSPGTPIFSRKYDLCLFWSYLTEQLGTTSAEPERGINFMRRFWEKLALNEDNDGVSAINELSRTKERGSLSNIFRDHVICNHTHDLYVSLLPDNERYRYRDEEAANGGSSYASVKTTELTVSPFAGFGTVDRYAAQYLEWVPTGAWPCNAVGFKGTANKNVGWALVGVTASQKVRLLSKGSGKEYGRVFFRSSSDPDPITRLCAMVIGFEDVADYSFKFDSGGTEMLLHRPTAEWPDSAGSAESPGRVQAAPVRLGTGKPDI